MDHTRELAPKSEQDQLQLLLTELRQGPQARALVWRGRFRRLTDYLLTIGLPLLTTWLLGYWTWDDVASLFADTGDAGTELGYSTGRL